MEGDEDKSGGIATNIGIHFFDMLIWIFGKHQSFTIQKKTNDTISGTLRLKKANVNWFLSINPENLPSEIKDKNISTHRILKIEGEEIDFTKGFTDLHTVSYKDILQGYGYGLNDVRESIEIVSRIRN